MDKSKYCFAIEGKTWSAIYEHYPDLLKKVMVRGSVFARMSPDQKQQLVIKLRTLGYYVGMLLIKILLICKKLYYLLTSFSDS